METTKLQRIGQLTPVWFLVGVAGVGAALGLTALGGVFAIIGAVAAVAIYWAVMKFVARRPVPELTRAGAGREVLLGAGIGFGAVLVSVLLITVFGGYSFHAGSGGFFGVLVGSAVVALGAAVTEELIFRGLFFQAVQRHFGGWAALGVTAAFFGLLHLANPAATVWSSIAIAVEAGVLLGAGFWWRRNIWFVVALHWSWNTAVAWLGIPVSGHTSAGWFTVEATGPVWLTGGAFGLEASVVPVLVGLGVAVAMLRRR